VTLYTTCFLLMFRLVPVYWKEQLHIGESRIGLLLGLNGIIIAIFEMVLVRYWESRRSHMYYIIAGAVLTALGYSALVVPAGSALSMAALAVVLLTIGEMLAFPFINTVIMGRAQDHNRGKYAGAYALSWSVSQIAGPGGGAFIIQEWGYGALWMILALLCLLCALTFRLLPGKA
jgi:predicted MFS family arabinose efflux permease